MSKKRKQEPAPDPVEVLAATLPEEVGALKALARDAVGRYHRAVVASDEAGAEAAAQLYDACITRANGMTRFGCYADDGAGKALERACAAKPGEVPIWGQAGEFIVEVDGIVALVKVEALGHWHGCQHFELHAVHPAAKFVSETGYRSCFVHARPAGISVDEGARQVIRGLIAEKRPVFIGLEYRERLAERLREDFPWVGAVPEGAQPMTYLESGGQLALAI